MVLLVLLSPLLLGAEPTGATQTQSAPQAAQIGAQPAAAPVVLTQSGRVQQDEALSIGKGLRCPVCQGMPIAESPASMAQDMMKLVRQMLAQGKTAAQINQYFVARYGEWVLLAPPAKGINWVVWLLPPMSLVLAVAWVLTASREPARPAAAAASSTDRYLQAIRDEIEQEG